MFVNSLSTAEDRPIALRMRPDLVLQESVYQKQRCWIVKDPVSLKYFRLLEPEYLILSRLNGKNSYLQIKCELDRAFPEFTTRYEDLQMLVSSLHKSGLVLGDMPGQAPTLVKRARKQKRQKLLQVFSSILAIRLPGVDPERFLQWAYPKIRWFFAPWCVTLCLVIVALAGILVLQNLDEFYRRLPGFEKFFSAQNFLLMGLVLMVTKVIHEFGHGFSCKHFGGECHEIGFMLLVLTPAMYCNTSDSWVLPNKWHRAAIGAAGMYVEVVMAAICTFIWWNTQPGMLNYLALNVMFICSVSTIIFNANPLLRYDGYYILSDLLEIPNLSQKSQMALLSKTRTICLGMEPIRSRLLPQTNQWMFALYSVASFCYRWFVLIMILYFLAQVFEPYGLQVIGHTIIAFSLIGLVVMPMFKMVKFFSYPGRFRKVKLGRFLITCTVAGLVLAGIWMLPLPHHVPATVFIEPLGANPVYVTLPASLKQVYVKAGDRVHKGDLLAELDDSDIRLKIAQVEGAIAELELEIYALKSVDPSLSNTAQAIQRAQSELIQKQKTLKILQRQKERTKLIASQDGIVIPAPWQSRQPLPEKQLASWSGSLLDERNRGALLMDQTLFCHIGDPQKMKATLLVDQSDIGFVALEQPVAMMLEEYPGRRFEGQITDIAQIDLRQVPRELSQTFGGPVPINPDMTGSERALFVSYLASVPLDNSQGKLLPGFRGQAKIRVGNSNLGNWALRQIWKVIYFR
jgi:putative peptide zinc metalloprotease protein